MLFSLAIYIWLKAPEIRFGAGMIISLPCFLLVLVCNKLNLIDTLGITTLCQL